MSGGGFHLDTSPLATRLSGVDINSASEQNVAKAAAHLEGEIKSRAPVDFGHLKASYDHRVNGTTAIVGTNVEYAIYQEYGTRYQSGTAHVRPAVDANRTQLVEMMAGETLRNAFDL